MARDKTIKILRTTKANLETQKTGSGLLAGEPYFVTDEDRVAIGKAVDDYVEMAKKSEVDVLPTKANIQNGSLVYAADAGSTDAYAINLSPAPTTYTSGMVLHFKANTVNTGACTLNVNSLGAATIKKNYNVDLADGDIKANQLVSVIYDGTNFQLLSPVANVAGGSSILVARKTADETVYNSETLQDDDHLTLSVENGTYQFEMVLIAKSNGTAGFKGYISLPAAGNAQLGIVGNTSGYTSFASSYVDVNSSSSINLDMGSYLFCTTTNKCVIIVKGIIDTGGAGTLKLQWAQQVATAITTYLYEGSYMKLTKLT